MSTKIISWNVNGLRSPSMSVINKEKKLNSDSNLYKLIDNYDPDIICFGETKCQKKNEELFNNILPFKFKAWNSSIDKLGYSGVAVFSKIPFIQHKCIPGLENDIQGRNLLLEFDKFILANVYVPNTGSDKNTYRRDVWDPAIKQFLKDYKMNEKPIIYCGDLNVVSDINDIYNEDLIKKAKNPGLKDFERNAFKSFLDIGYFDAHRKIYKNEKIWTWWDPRSKARVKNNGWRLDYFLVSDENIIKNAIVHDNIYGSDHCPISLELFL